MIVQGEFTGLEIIGNTALKPEINFIENLKKSNKKNLKKRYLLRINRKKKLRKKHLKSQHRFNKTRNCTSLGYSQPFHNRWYDPKVGQFISKDLMGIAYKLDDPFTYNEYCFVNNNPWRYTDPEGLKSYLIFAGEENSDNIGFIEKANLLRDKLLQSPKYDKKNDTVAVIKGYTVNDWIKALNRYKDIEEIYYYGHGGLGHLYIGSPAGAIYNISKYSGPHKIVKDLGFNLTKNYFSASPVSLLPTKNVTGSIKIYLYSCNAGEEWFRYKKGDVKGRFRCEESIAQVFADHFNASVYAADEPIKFSGCNAQVSWRRQFFKDGSFKWFYPIDDKKFPKLRALIMDIELKNYKP